MINLVKATDKPKYTVDYFINKFSNIPDNLWGTGWIKLNDRRCVFGHCDTIDTPNGYKNGPESLGLIKVFFPTNELEEKEQMKNIYSINDSGGVRFYDFPTPPRKGY